MIFVKLRRFRNRKESVLTAMKDLLTRIDWQVLNVDEIIIINWNRSRCKATSWSFVDVRVKEEVTIEEKENKNKKRMIFM